MKDDYLWDPSGPPDPEVERLERMLGRLRSTRRAGPGTARTSPRRRRPRPQARAPTLLRAVPRAGARRRGRDRRDDRPHLADDTRNAARGKVAHETGSRASARRRSPATGRLAVGQTLVTDAASRARLDVSTIGQVTVDTDSRVRLVDTRDGHHNWRSNAAPCTRSSRPARPVHRGHAVGDSHRSRLRLHTARGRGRQRACSASPPAGSRSSSTAANRSSPPARQLEPIRAIGPGTPRYDDAERRCGTALDDFDYGTDAAAKAQRAPGRAPARAPRDAMTLWHLIARVSPADRAAVVDALDTRVPMPASVTREAVMRLDKAALDQWWDALGLRDTGWWRKWKRTVP